MGLASDQQQAVALFDALLPDCNRVLGPVHPDTLSIRQSHAVSVRKAGNPGQAVALLDKLLPDYTRTLGPDHPDTRQTRAYRRKYL
ncbi:tetratricopeptide repeat protein [Streptomyces sp. NPDC054874]